MGIYQHLGVVFQSMNQDYYLNWTILCEIDREVKLGHKLVENVCQVEQLF